VHGISQVLLQPILQLYLQVKIHKDNLILVLVTFLNLYGVLLIVAVIVAILGIGRIAQKPIVRDGEIVAAPVLALSLSFDHRMIDGATGQNALNHIKRLLNDPELLLMEA